jgi:predicted dehydrogenase
MEIYGTTGYIKADNDQEMRVRSEEMKREKQKSVTSGDVDVYEDPFAYFYDVIKGNVEVEPYGLYSLENNIRVVKILDAARQSARTGETVIWEE